MRARIETTCLRESQACLALHRLSTNYHISSLRTLEFRQGNASQWPISLVLNRYIVSNPARKFSAMGLLVQSAIRFALWIQRTFPSDILFVSTDITLSGILYLLRSDSKLPTPSYFKKPTLAAW